MKPTEPEPQVELQEKEPKECVVAGASAMSQITLEPVNDSDNEGGDEFNFDADTESNADEEMAEEPEVERQKNSEEPAQPEPEDGELEELAEPEVEREKTPEEPTQSEPEEEPEPQFSPVQSSSNSSSEESDSTVSTSASSSSASSYSDSGNDSYSSVNHFDSDEESVNPNNDYRKISVLQESIRLDGHVVNILYDEGADMSLMSSKITVPVFREIMQRCEAIAVEGEGTGLETCPIVDIPLPMYCEGGGMARVSVTARDFPEMTTDPPLEAIAEKLDFPPSVFTPRREGAVQLILGVDNRHLFPLPMVSSQDRVFSIQLWRSRLTGGMIYHGALAVWTIFKD
jgi:hypothetical protein